MSLRGVKQLRNLNTTEMPPPGTTKNHITTDYSESGHTERSRSVSKHDENNNSKVTVRSKKNF